MSRSYRQLFTVYALACACLSASMAGSTDGDEESKTTKQRRIAIVVHKDNPIDTLELGELRRIFLREKSRWPKDGAITVFDRHSDNPIQSLFADHVLRMTPGKLHEYWLNMKLTRGIEAPKRLRSARLLKNYLKRTKGGIGYMFEDEVDDTMRVVKLLSIPEKV